MKPPRLSTAAIALVVGSSSTRHNGGPRDILWSPPAGERGGAEMSTWKNSSADTYTKGEQFACEVRITTFEIVVSYETGQGAVTYQGKEVAPGHFELTCEEIDGKASLHRSPDGEWLEGWWSEGQDEGMWRIRLGE
jgi:hypothetical protein